MVVRRALVIVNGEMQELPSGDTLAGTGGGGSLISGTVTLSFGAGSTVVSSNTTVTGISTADQVIVSPSAVMANSTTYLDEYEFEQVMVVGDVPATNTLRIRAYSTGKIYGDRIFNYIILQ